jgi:hypothetical protein
MSAPPDGAPRDDHDDVPTEQPTVDSSRSNKRTAEDACLAEDAARLVRREGRQRRTEQRSGTHTTQVRYCCVCVEKFDDVNASQNHNRERHNNSAPPDVRTCPYCKISLHRMRTFPKFSHLEACSSREHAQESADGGFPDATDGFPDVSAGDAPPTSAGDAPVLPVFAVGDLAYSSAHHRVGIVRHVAGDCCTVEFYEEGGENTVVPIPLGSLHRYAPQANPVAADSEPDAADVGVAESSDDRNAPPSYWSELLGITNSMKSKKDARMVQQFLDSVNRHPVGERVFPQTLEEMRASCSAETPGIRVKRLKVPRRFFGTEVDIRDAKCWLQQEFADHKEEECISVATVMQWWNSASEAEKMLPPHPMYSRVVNYLIQYFEHTGNNDADRVRFCPLMMWGDAWACVSFGKNGGSFSPSSLVPSPSRRLIPFPAFARPGPAYTIAVCRLDRGKLRWGTLAFIKCAKKYSNDETELLLQWVMVR